MQIHIASNPCKTAGLTPRIRKGHLDFSTVGNVSRHWITCSVLHSRTYLFDGFLENFHNYYIFSIAEKPSHLENDQVQETVRKPSNLLTIAVGVQQKDMVNKIVSKVSFSTMNPSLTLLRFLRLLISKQHFLVSSVLWGFCYHFVPLWWKSKWVGSIWMVTKSYSHKCTKTG